MPKAKKSQVVHLTKVQSKGQKGRGAVMKAVQEAASAYDYVWVFSVENMRNQYLKTVRSNFKTSRFFFGSNKVMAKALGNEPETEIKENIHKISNALVGDVGLLFTNESVESVKKSFDEYEADDYARAGNIATYRVVVPAGEVFRGYAKEPFPNNMEPEMRDLGMPTRLREGKITIDSDYVICEEGDRLTSQQSRLLKHFWEKMAVFKIKLMCHWHNSGEFVQLVGSEASAEESEESDEEME
ncbi:ribosomal protein L10-domain-containing protein [Kickxella alabastrina]|uniref:ribosomal protein L10-domain-containing protein n=1 Tax=Kickxella alabastrina TaxID=61397 RepID=UPI00222067B4|nr:ribosomal protein L10-domain-containing protein [Kickxella alabastrina]KAI7834175.1 ribosomal protein L10-domain-containing protein [Kickxella alabastrina]